MNETPALTAQSLPQLARAFTAAHALSTGPAAETMLAVKIELEGEILARGHVLVYVAGGAWETEEAPAHAL